jgi:hypothetical protein
MWNPAGPEPKTIWEVLHRQKDIQYSSRVANHIARQLQTHRLRHVIKELVTHIPEDTRNSEAVRELASFGCLTRMHVVRLLAPRVDNEDHTKDVDFSPAGIRQRWEAGYENARRAIELAPWQGAFDPLDGVILHEPQDSARVQQVVGESELAVQREDTLAVATDAADTRQRRILVPDKNQGAVAAGGARGPGPAHWRRMP